MLDIRQTYPLTDFLRNHKAHIDRIKETGAPEVLTVDGRAEVVILEPGVFQDLVARAERLETIQAGIAAEDRGALQPVPSPRRKQSFREAAEATLEQYDEALKRLAE